MNKHDIVNLEPAFVLHTKPYSNTSLIISFLTKNFGKINVLAKGSRNHKYKYKSILQPFIPLTINMKVGRGMPLLCSVDLSDLYKMICLKKIVYGLYINELTYKLLISNDPCMELFMYYKRAVLGLLRDIEIIPILRIYEKRILDSIGYGYDYAYDCMTNKKICSTNEYFHYIDKGFTLLNMHDEFLFSGNMIAGNIINNIAQDEFVDASTQYKSRFILKSSITHRLAGMNINSRNILLKQSKD